MRTSVRDVARRTGHQENARDDAEGRDVVHP